MSLSVGTRLGPYEVVSAIGAGGMGEVYKARDTKLNRDVALKVLPESFATDSDRLARFKREAQVLASLNHQNIAQIHGFEEDPVTGAAALVLEYVDGETLAEMIDASPLDVDDVLPIAIQIAEGLEAAHEKGIVHRDLKPANVKVTSDGTVKVLDFGLAKALQDEQSPENTANSPTMTEAATRAGIILGTAAYMSPEQARGRPVDRRTDNWAFGCVLYELLTGDQTYEGETISDVIASVLTKEPDWSALPALPAGVTKLLRRCLEKDAKRRLQHIGDARLELEDAQAQTDEGAEVVSADISRRGGASYLALAGVAVIAAIVTGLVTSRMAPVPPREIIEFTVPVDLGSFLANDPPLAISPDGTQIAFRAETPDGIQLFIRAIDSAELRPVPSTEAAHNPFFSPDGTRLGFFQDTDRALRTVSLETGQVVTVFETQSGHNGATWGEDGAIVFSQFEGGLGRVAASGGIPDALTTPDPSTGEIHQFPHFLPGGRAVIFTIVNAGGSSTLATVSVATGEVSRLIADADDAHYAAGHLVYSIDGAVWVQPFDPERLELLGDAIPSGIDVGLTSDGPGNFAVSATGTLVHATPNLTTENRLVVVNQGGEIEEVVSDWHDQMRAVQVTPDGRGVFSISGPRAPTNDLWLYDLQGGPAMPLVSTTQAGLGEYYAAAMSPDGDRIALSVLGPSSGLYWIALDGSMAAPEPFTFSTQPFAGWENVRQWRDDGLLIDTCTVATTGCDILLIPLDGGNVQPLLATNDDELFPIVSPNGRWLAYLSRVTGELEVWARPHGAEGAPVRISIGGGWAPVWGRDGRDLFFVSVTGFVPGSVGNAGDLMRVRLPDPNLLAFETPEPLFSLPRILFDDIAPFGVLPDDRFVMIESPESGAAEPFTVVVNWIDTLAERAP